VSGVVGESDARQQAALNPYQSPRENCETAKPAPTLAPLSDFYWWRVYLLLHLAIIFAAPIYGFVDSGYWRPAIGVESVIAGFLGLLVTIGIVDAIYVSPILMLVLFARAFTSNCRYAFIGIAELLLTCVHVLVAQPLFQ
jgi:hypothetical protein